VLSIGADSLTDSYRAGFCAGLFAGESGGVVVVFQDDGDFPVNRGAFLAGLRRGDFQGDPLYLGLAANYPANEEVSCVVLTGNAGSFLEKKAGVPVILFSWMDPALASEDVKLVFDDSPWALAVRSFHLAAAGEAGALAADILIQKGRIGDAALLRRIKNAAKEEIPREFNN
jgi:hypothetical protein